jgi:hypothetical protein
MRGFAIVMLAAGCAPTLVQNQPKTVLLAMSYDAGEVRNAVVRSVNKLRLSPQGETEGQALVLDTRHGANCFLTVQYTGANVVISSVQDATEPGMIDKRCLIEQDSLARVIAKEVMRPAKIAAKAERAARRHELEMAREQRMTEEAALQREQLQQQQAQAPVGDPNAVPPDDTAQPVDAPAADYQPAAASTNNNNSNNTYVYQNNNSVSNSSSNTTITSTVINASPPSEPQAPPISPLLCCRQKQPYVCPSVAVYAASCIQKPATLANACRVDPQQARYCH